MTTWILLRGLTREAGHWGRFLQDFRAARGDGAVVVPVDLPGNGALHAERSPWRVEDMLAACRSHLERAGWEPPFHVLAMSLGAMVAVDWMQRFPDDIAACVLINTSLRGFSPFHQRLRWRNYGDLLALAHTWKRPAQAESIIYRMTSQGHAPHQATLADWAAIRAQRPVSRANALRQLAAAALYRPIARPPRVPVLLLTSQGDGLVDFRCTLAIARAWPCTVAAHPVAGHDLPLDAPEWVVARVGAWLEALECAGGR